MGRDIYTTLYSGYKLNDIKEVFYKAYEFSTDYAGDDHWQGCKVLCLENSDLLSRYMDDMEDEELIFGIEVQGWGEGGYQEFELEKVPFDTQQRLINKLIHVEHYPIFITLLEEFIKENKPKLYIGTVVW